MRVLLIILGMASVLSGCRTSRNMDVDKNTSYHSGLDEIDAKFDSIMATIKIQQHEISEKLSDIKSSSRTVYYSDPDSTGKQYPIVVSETSTSREDKESKDTFTDTEASIREIRDEVRQLTSNVDSLLQEKSKVVEMSWWDMNKWYVYLSAVAVIVILSLVYKLKR